MANHFLIMGVCGTGKTTIGKQLAEALGCAFEDADTYHPTANVAKMKQGIPLNDADRADWLEKLNGMLRERERNGNALVLACSALKQKYREVLSQGLDSLEVIFLNGSRKLLAERIQQRSNHYMPASLLDSQLADLEVPQNGLTIDVSLTPEEIIRKIITHFKPNSEAL
jgi:carbohydrate kinase (thermoresistant glucokinase family)